MLTTGAGPTAKDGDGPYRPRPRYSSGTLPIRCGLPTRSPRRSMRYMLAISFRCLARRTQTERKSLPRRWFREASEISQDCCSSVDTSASTLTVKDLATKKNVTVHITPDAEMRRLPDMMAKMIAARLKGGASAAGGATTDGTAARRGTGASAPSGYGAGAGQGAGRWSGQARRSGRRQSRRCLTARRPCNLAICKRAKRSCWYPPRARRMLLQSSCWPASSRCLESPEASRDLLSNWSMGSGGGGEAAAQ